MDYFRNHILSWRKENRRIIHTLKEFKLVGHSTDPDIPNNSYELFQKLIIELRYKVVECDIVFTVDNVPVLNHDNCQKAKELSTGKELIIDITQIHSDSITNYVFPVNKPTPLRLCTLEKLILLAKENNVWVQLDLAKENHTIVQLYEVYSIIRKNSYLDKVIWEVNKPDFYKLVKFDKNIIVQFDHSWNLRSICYAKLLSVLCKLIILNQWILGRDLTKADSIIKYGHALGFLMKCAPVNDIDLAENMFNKGVDMILSDRIRPIQV